MSLHRTKATFIGLLEAGRVNEWIVTEKLGHVLQTKLASKVPKKLRFRMGDRYNPSSYCDKVGRRLIKYFFLFLFLCNF